jgi:hypothetical protein
MTDANAGRRVSIVGDESGYKVYTIEPDGEVRELPARAVTIQMQQLDNGEFYAEALCYFTHPSLKVEAPRASDGVRAG